MIADVVTDQQVTLATEAMRAAPAVIGAVHDLDPTAVEDILAPMTVGQLTALVVVLAAAFDPETAFMPTLHWVDPDAPDVLAKYVQHRDGLRPCGTHAAYVRHKDRGEDVDDACLFAHREYDRLRKRNARAPEPFPRGPERSKPCGTTAAYRWHLRHGEKPCEPCSEANRQDKKAARSSRTKEKAA